MNKYGSLQNYIKNNIDSGVYPQGSALPSEKWFEEYFGVSRVTVRNAINGLIKEGIIEREKGKSPKVPSQRYDRNFNRLTGFSEQILEDGHIPSAKILEFSVIKATAFLARKLKIKTDDEVTYIRRLRYSDGQVICIQEIYLNRAYSAFLTEYDLLYKSLYSIMEEKGVSFDYSEQVIKTSMPTAEQRELLDLDSKTPVFIMERITYHKNGDAIEYVKTCCDSNKYNIKINLYR